MKRQCSTHKRTTYAAMVKYEEPLWASMRKMHVTGVDSQDGTTREPSAIKKREGPGYVEALQWLRNEGGAKGVGAEQVFNADECWNHEMEHVPWKRLRSGGSEHDSLRHC